MGLKNWLWNDNARELFCAREASGDGAFQPASGSHSKDRARKLAKGSAAFTSALLFGTSESQGLLRTFGQASARGHVSPCRSGSNLESSERLDMHGLAGAGYYDKNGVITYHLDED